jgi:hypothetical protein
VRSGATVQVRTYSGHTYAQRPLSFTLGEREHQVKEVLKAWREPGAACFRVLTEEGLTFTLAYQEAKDQWRLGDPRGG